jgi:hypothetical protein
MGRRFWHGAHQERWPGRVPGHQELWLCRAVRGARPDRNPLRRRTDRLETCVLAGLFVAAAAGAPFAAQAAGHAWHAGAAQARQAQLAARHEVTAVLAQSAGVIGEYTLSSQAPTLASWTSAGGARRAGDVPATPGSPSGTLVSVWTDDNGYLVSPPLTVTQVADQTDAARVAAVGGIIIGYTASTLAIRQLLNRRRMAAWDADWAATARVWNRQTWWR